MREIKFRGKRIDNGEWVYGAFVPDALETPDNDLITWGFIRRYNRDIGKMETIEVARESVGQYIGLCDKNGKKIYEGDIVICPVHEESVDYLQLEAGDKNHVTRTICIPDCYQEGLPEDCKVIGNIHDNPDLLEVTPCAEQ
jgi:uncharacterized phage protein (TIGR01671 family)